MSKYGIDVSENQGTIDWGQVKADGVSFAILRSVKRNLSADLYFEANYRGCRENGIPVGTVKILALIETAAGVEHAYDIACASKRMTGVFLGAEDLTADLRCARTKEGGEIAYARGRLVCAARAAGIDAYDCPFTDVEDSEGLEKDTRLAKSLGFSGKAAINPRQVDCINQVFSPTAAEIEYAKEVFKAIEEGKKQGKGAVSLRGKMIDAPIVSRAATVLDMAEKLGGGIPE